MILEEFEALEADFQAHYGIDLRRALWGPIPLSARRLLALVKGLPPGSALHRSVDPEGYGWTNNEELLATLLEVTDLSNRMFYSANSGKNARQPVPLTVVRPGAAKSAAKRSSGDSRKPQESSVEAIKKFMGKKIKKDV